MSINVLIRRTFKELRHKGIMYVIHAGSVVIYNWTIYSLWIKRFKKKKSFSFLDKKYKYFYHWHNPTWRSERAVEVPIIYNILKKYTNKKILEIGNVLSYYYPVKHLILDKYDLAENILNEDIVGYKPKQKFDLIISISTMEHVGWDEIPKDAQKFISGIRSIKQCLHKKGLAVITLPLGYNTTVNRSLSNKNRVYEKLFFMKRISEDNIWQEASWDEVKNVKYGYPYNAANAIAVCFLRNS